MPTEPQSHEPKSGDFADLIEQAARRPGNTEGEARETVAEPGTTLEGILVHGEEPTAEFLEEFAALESAEELNDDELERQSLEAPGADGDPSTPE